MEYWFICGNWSPYIEVASLELLALGELGSGEVDRKTLIYPRMNTDQKLCDYGNQLLNLCKGNGLRIVNGRKIGDSLGKPTCFKWNGFSVVDYAIVDVDMFSLILSFKVPDILETWSDHCPISMTVNICLQRNSQPYNSPRTKLSVKQKLGERKKEMFKIVLRSFWRMHFSLEPYSMPGARRHRAGFQWIEQNSVWCSRGRARKKYQAKAW